ncbi:hypothetical protein XH93_04620 [Bradyrhizobium sp. CCBAU 51753]|nr:hypothetical protein XH93_04620 [Bradyrhizobium sp. CCBAU 51753]
MVVAGKCVPEKDDKFRDALAADNSDYRLLRDAAFAIKHGQLTGQKLRVVTSSQQIAIYGAVVEEGVVEGDVFKMGTARIEIDGTSVDVMEIAERVNAFLYEVLERTAGINQRQFSIEGLEQFKCSSWIRKQDETSFNRRLIDALAIMPVKLKKFCPS